MVWIKFDIGFYSEFIWVFEIYFNEGVWYVYFVVVLSCEIKDDLFQYWMYVIKCDVVNLVDGEWEFCGQIEMLWDIFCFDVIIFYYNDELYYCWVQKELGICGNLNLYLVKMEMFIKIIGDIV